MSAPFDAPPSPLAQRRAAIVRWVLIGGFAALAVTGFVVGFDLLGSGATSEQGQVWYCPMHPQIRADRPGQCPICGMDLVLDDHGGTPTAAAPVKLFCPRHPLIRSDIPGLCPLDGEPLVPMRVEGRATVGISPDRVRQIGVVSVLVERRAVERSIEAPAQVAVDESRVAVVDTRLPGWITALRVRDAGQVVRRGQPLATLTSTDLYAAESQLVAARQTAAVLGVRGAGLVEQERARLLALGVPAAEINRVANGGEAATKLGLRAPRAGTVVVLGVSEGAFVAPGTVLFTIADLSRAWVLADLAEHDAAAVRPGDEARVEAPLAPGRTFVGRVELLEPFVDPRTRTRRARIVIEDAAEALVPGAVATARFAGAGREVLVVPRDAVLTAERDQHVFVDLGEGRFEPRPVTTGEEREGWVEIRTGLAEGERVASAAAFLLDAESQLRANAERGEPGAHEGHGSGTEDGPAQHDRGERHGRP